MSNLKLTDILISPEIWPDKKLKIQPGDLSQFAPFGNGVYGYEENNYQPIVGDPSQEENAGILYFGNQVKEEDFYTFLRMMDINIENKDYAVFTKEASNPEEERFFKQLRVVSKFGLKYLFGALDKREYEDFNKQKLTLGEVLWEFMQDEKEKYGTDFGDPRIERKMGGDGNYAREELSFGFMLENDYHDVYRIWSRAWLVTK